MLSKDTHVISISEDYSFAQVLAYLQRSAQECLHTVTADGRLIKAFDAGGRLLLLEVGAGAEPGELALRLLAEGRDTAGSRGFADSKDLADGGGFAENRDLAVSRGPAHSWAPTGSRAVAESRGFTASQDAAAAGIDAAVMALVREWLDADVELTPFYEMGRTDEILHEVVERGRGLRIVGIPDLFEALVWAIMGQQINLTFAYKLKRSFVEAFGRSLEHEGRRHWLFPTPERIAAVEPGELTAMQLSASKTQCILTTARLIAAGELDKAALAAAKPEEAVAALTAVRGIGPWTAHYVSMHCLRHRDAYPAEDAGLHNALRTRLGLPGKPPLAVVREWGERWRPWRAYAVFYLWNVR